MKINETIKTKRKEFGLTQEQVAERLGVTASAVYKWEKGSAFPDITILPPLARLLQTDLNTLLSFREELTSQEIQNMVSEVAKTVNDNGFKAGFLLAQDMLCEFPACDELLLQMASSLQGMQMLYPKEDAFECDETIMRWYQRLSQSKEKKLRDQANEIIFFNFMNKGELDQAESILEKLEETGPRYAQMKAGLYMKQDRQKEAKRIMENKLLVAAGEVQNALLWLQSCALKEQDWDMAQDLAAVLEQTVNTLSLWKYGACIPYLQLYAAREDVENCIEILRRAFREGQDAWIPCASKLYRDLTPKAQESLLQQRICSVLLELIKTDESMAFLRAADKGEKFIQEMEEIYGAKDNSEIS